MAKREELSEFIQGRKREAIVFAFCWVLLLVYVTFFPESYSVRTKGEGFKFFLLISPPVYLFFEYMAFKKRR